MVSQTHTKWCLKHIRNGVPNTYEMVSQTHTKWCPKHIQNGVSNKLKKVSEKEKMFNITFYRLIIVIHQRYLQS